MKKIIHIIKGTPLYFWAVLCCLLFLVIITIKTHSSDDNQLKGYKKVYSIYHHQISLNNKTFVLRFFIPSNWKIDEDNRLKLNLDALLVDDKNINDANMFISLLHMQFADKKTDNQTVIDNIQKTLESSGYEKDNFLSSLKLYDGRDFIVMSKKDLEYEYNRKELFLFFKEEPKIFLRLAFQINNIDAEYFDKNILIFTRLIKSMRVVQLDVDDKTKADYAKDVLSKIFPQT
jgi:hypothetical protein